MKCCDDLLRRMMIRNIFKMPVQREKKMNWFLFKDTARFKSWKSVIFHFFQVVLVDTLYPTSVRLMFCIKRIVEKRNPTTTQCTLPKSENNLESSLCFG